MHLLWHSPASTQPGFCGSRRLHGCVPDAVGSHSHCVTAVPMSFHGKVPAMMGTLQEWGLYCLRFRVFGNYPMRFDGTETGAKLCSLGISGLETNDDWRIARLANSKLLLRLH